MRSFSIVLILSGLALGFSSCEEKNETPVDPVVLSLVTSLNEEKTNISALDPNIWTDNDLKFLDVYGSKKIVGFGEATHGTYEFFKAKHRAFRYLVEKHGFKVFAIEADVGESILINNAVLKSDKSAIVTLMLNNMHFWTWQTNEVRDLLFWMCDYNQGKPEAEKLQYWGVDCQYNTYYPEMLKSILEAVNAPFQTTAKPFLDETKALVKNRFPNYSGENFLVYLRRVDALTDSLTKYKSLVVAAWSEKYFEFTLHLVDLIKQSSKIVYYGSTGNNYNYRDEFMADNTVWLNKYLDGKKMFLWAHNFHVSRSPSWGTQGNYIDDDIPEYAAIGFLFSKGTFRAVAQTAPGQFAGLGVQVLDDEPLSGSLNDVMSRADGPVFTVKISDLQNHEEWNASFQKGIKYFQVGSVFNDKTPQDYYSNFDPAFFDQVIYFNITTSATKVL